MENVRLEDATETAKALRKECDNCSCFKDPFMCGLGPCQNIRAADLLDAQAARIAEREARIAELEAQLAEVAQERDFAIALLAGNCDACANIEECEKHPCYCINGSSYLYKGRITEVGKP